MSDKPIEDQAATIAELRERLREAEAGDGWQELGRVSRKLGEIISDNYEDRSMWPRLARVKRWWDDMRRAKEAAEARAAAAERALVESEGRVAGLAALLDAQPYQNSVLTVVQIRRALPASARLAADVLTASERRGIAEAKILQAALAELKPAPEKIAILEAELSAACTEWRAAVAAWRAGRK